MKITLNRKTIEAVGEDLAPWGLGTEQLKWHKHHTIDLSEFTKTKTQELRAALMKHKKVYGVSSRILDIDQWLAILEGEKVRCRRIDKFDALLKQYLKPIDKHWLFQRNEDDDFAQPYYVGNINYTPPYQRDGVYHAAYVTMSIFYREFGTVHSDIITFYAKDCEELTIGKALALKGFTVPTPELVADYHKTIQKYDGLYSKVGMQVLARGVGTDSGVDADDDEDRYWRQSNEHVLDRDGIPSRVVIDALMESDKKQRSRHDSSYNDRFWDLEPCNVKGSEDDDEKDFGPGDEDDAPESVPADIPIMPMIVAFDLKRHWRMKVHVNNVEPYPYMEGLDSKLILPKENTDLVKLLVSKRGTFKDIIGNKGGGAVILCAGPPGTGKTLTAEVYAESMKLPLYSVQCSQLGLDHTSLEKELMRVFSRAQRWNAILLLDEADVYVTKRGNDLEQNAIVGVFLRVLEYYHGVLFMTTNRDDLVDDAIASRCLAKINYEVPKPELQKRIWRTLADTAGIGIKDEEIEKIVKRFPHLSGRDVKNLLKLSSMVASADGADGISANTVEFVKRFKPTADVFSASVDTE